MGFKLQIRVSLRLCAQFRTFGFGKLSPPYQLAQWVLDRLAFHRIL
jgi:hypothetical protein